VSLAPLNFLLSSRLLRSIVFVHRIATQKTLAMTTKLHTALSLSTLTTINYLIYLKSSALIGFIHGPSAQLAALKEYQFTNSLLGAQKVTWCDAYDTAYANSTLLRDAGTIAALFTIILVFIPGFLSLNHTKTQRMSFLLLLPLLWITPGLIGQILAEHIPIELAFLENFGVRGIGMIEYCSLHSLVLEGRELSSMTEVVIYEANLVGVASAMLFLVLGIMPIVDRKSNLDEK
jgi:hypothetical protein